MNKLFTYIIIITTMFLSCKFANNENKQNISHHKNKYSCVKKIEIDESRYLCYQRKDSMLNNLYNEPYIVERTIQYKIEGIEEDVGTGFWSISPNKKYLMLYKIGFSFISEDSTKFFEKYSHLIIDINQHEIVKELYANDCDGFWSENDEWIRNLDSVIVFE